MALNESYIQGCVGPGAWGRDPVNDVDSNTLYLPPQQGRKGEREGQAQKSPETQASLGHRDEGCSLKQPGMQGPGFPESTVLSSGRHVPRQKQIF